MILSPLRFKGMSALFASTSHEARELARATGLTLLPEVTNRSGLKASESSADHKVTQPGYNEALGGGTHDLPSPEEYTRFLLSELGGWAG